MVTVTDMFGVTNEELETIQNEANRIASLGYNVPNIIVKFLPHAQGMAGLDNIYIHPNGDLAQLRFTVAHEIGHHNESVEVDIWAEPKSYEQKVQESEDFANWFAANV